MLQKTKGIVLRAIKYGETSLVCSIFTELYGVQSYIIQGVRTSGKKKQNRAGLLQPATLLDMVVYHKQEGGLQRIKEFQPSYIYNTLHEDIVKNSIGLFTVELLLRVLPENAEMQALFQLTEEYFQSLDTNSMASVANYPLYFLVQCCDILGYTIQGEYSDITPHLNLSEGGFSELLPAGVPHVSNEGAISLNDILSTDNLADVGRVRMNGSVRFALMDWLLAFMHSHTQHMGEIKSLPVLRAILH